MEDFGYASKIFQKLPHLGSQSHTFIKVDSLILSQLNRYYPLILMIVWFLKTISIIYIKKINVNFYSIWDNNAIVLESCLIGGKPIGKLLRAPFW